MSSGERDILGRKYQAVYAITPAYSPTKIRHSAHVNKLYNSSKYNTMIFSISSKKNHDSSRLLFLERFPNDHQTWKKGNWQTTEDSPPLFFVSLYVQNISSFFQLIQAIRVTDTKILMHMGMGLIGLTSLSLKSWFESLPSTFFGEFPASSGVAMVCCLGRRRRARLIPNDDWRNHGIEILRRLLGGFLELEEPFSPSEPGGGVLEADDRPSSPLLRLPGARDGSEDILKHWQSSSDDGRSLRSILGYTRAKS